MNKRAQYFLLAALIVSTVLFSIGTLFNSAAVIPENRTAKELADEMSYEASELLNHDFLQGFQAQAEADIVSLSNSYAESHKDAEIVIIYGFSNSIKAKYYKQGSGTDFTSNITAIDPNSLKIDYNGQSYGFIKHAGYNYFVIVKTEDVYGKFIAIK